MFRKIVLYVAAISLVMVHGCAEFDQLQVKREVRGNVFSSTTPRLELRIDDDLKLIGAVEEERVPERKSFENDPLENTTKYLSYIFGDTAGDGMVVRGVVIRIRTITGNPNQVIEPLLPDRRNALVSGMTKILGDEYHSYAVAGENLFTGKERRALSGQNISGCLLVKGLERDFGLGNKSLLQILYFERILTSGGSPQCVKWQDPGALTDEQDRFLGGFLGRSCQGIRFVKGGEVVDSTAKYVDRDKNKDAAVETSPPAAAPRAGDIEERLEILKNLRDKDLITREEYDRKKAEILEGL